MKKPLPIGVDDFGKLIQNGYYYVDKTLFIKELLDKKGDANLFTRPRRFGKTLNMSMLRCFFENTGTESGNTEKARLFDGLAIMKCGKAYTDHMGKYPVISLSLKSGKQPTFEMARESLIDEIIKEFNRHDSVKTSGSLLENEREQFNAIQNHTASNLQYAKSLEFLSSCLVKCYRQKVILLIDEYDVPLENAYFCNFYEKMADFIRSLFESALKTNGNLEFGVITGCLRITRESIFTGLNNLKMISILNSSYGDYFGFTSEETETMLRFYGCEARMSTVKKWYNGYLFGDTQVYNPWSVINFMDQLSDNPDALPAPYWANTSSNQIVKDLVEHADLSMKGELEVLIEGGTITKPIHEDITYADIYQSEDNLWNFLFFTGYLKLVSRHMEGRIQYAQMAIPDEEVVYIYENTILSWFEQRILRRDMTALYTAMENSDSRSMERIISKELMDTISIYDYAENYYHGFLTGLLKSMKNYRVISNRESGTGRPDIIVKSPTIRGKAMIIECKIAENFSQMESKCREALRQIEKQNYTADLLAEGYHDILEYGICFYRKDCRVMSR
ncbi:AAA family ATPase [Eisenbergiella sp.]